MRDLMMAKTDDLLIRLAYIGLIDMRSNYQPFVVSQQINWTISFIYNILEKGTFHKNSKSLWQCQPR
jgi:hypothetical protein